jgi:hypothetical protein
MAEVRKLDSRRRGVFPDRFSPGDLFLEEEVGEDRVVFRRIRPKEVPRRSIKKRDGFLMVQAPLDTERIRAAVREDRDTR